uniref:Tetrahydroalstonine synthase 4 n=1 Tax=Catharanthus roseus TaxID=4058 RepID=A0A1B1FHP9_CATRO|nr:tetrahydroalstonine synthase 4 [Catharanthus roseus]
MAAKSPENVYSVKTFGFAAKDSSGLFSPFNFSRRATGENDVQFKVLYCGTCYYDWAMITNKYGMTNYPFVIGHEIIGVVTEVGSKVKKFKVGDKVGVGGHVGACEKCELCINGVENNCPEAESTDGFSGKNFGGCSNIMVVNEKYAVVWPENLPLHSGVPLLCAGITTYSPLRRYGLDKPGLNIGIAGLGGLGHLAIRFAKAFGAKVTLISSSVKKKREALEKFGVDSFLLNSNPEEMQGAYGTLDGIIDTMPVAHSIVPFLALLKPLGKLIILGVPEEPFEVPAPALLMGGKLIAGSAAGSMKETQEMIDFAAKHNIVADVEVIPIDYLNTAIERIKNSDVKYRFVIDVGNTLKSPSF